MPEAFGLSVYKRANGMFVVPEVVGPKWSGAMSSVNVVFLASGYGELGEALRRAEGVAIEQVQLPREQRDTPDSTKGLERAAGCRTYREFVRGSLMCSVDRLPSKSNVSLLVPSAREDGYDGTRTHRQLPPNAPIDDLVRVVQEFFDGVWTAECADGTPASPHRLSGGGQTQSRSSGARQKARQPRFETASQWTAVDEDGRVAVFISQSTGAVPVDALSEFETPDGERRSEGFEDLLAWPLLAALRVVTSEAVLDFEGSFAPDELHARPGRTTLLAGGHGAFHAFLHSVQSFRELAERHGAEFVRATRGEALVFSGKSDALKKVLQGSDQLLGVLPQPFDSPEHTALAMARSGLFVYEHLCEGWATGPYGRIAYPTAPISIDDVPQDLRPRVKLAVRFGATRYVQPCDHVACHTPYPKYLAADFKTLARARRARGS